MLRYPLFPILALACSAGAGPLLILSEAMADPSALPDAQGEFVELGNTGPGEAAPDSLTLSIDGQILRMGAVSLGPGAVFLLCRDSAAYAAAGVRCDRGWSGLSLANTRSLDAVLEWPGGRFRTALPPARAGASWENTWDPSADYLAFLPSIAGKGGDSATPGARNSRSSRPAARDLAVASVSASGNRIRIGIEDRGTVAPAPARVFLRLDRDWDGTAEEALDSAVMDGSGPYPAMVEFASGVRRGRVEAALAPDENPANDRLSAALEPGGGPLAFGAFCAAPSGEEPEWLEIRNVTLATDPPGRRIALASATAGGMPFGAAAGTLDPGERLFLAADSAAFRARFGALKARVLRPDRWRALRNTGDTLALALSGIPVDTLAWGAGGEREGSRAAGGPYGAGRPSEAHGWRLSGREAAERTPLKVEVSAPQGAAYALRAFDLEGNRVRSIGSGGPGVREHAWDGRGDGGRKLPFGPYVVSLAFARGPAFKRAVLAGER